MNWQKSEIANLLPLPKSVIRKVSADSADGCYIYVGGTSIDDSEAESETSSDNTELVDGMLPKFKNAMGGYEEFMDEYCDFVENMRSSME